MGAGVITWSTEGPTGWKNSEKKKLSGSLEKTSASLKVEIRLLNKESLSNEDKKKDSFEYVEIKLESGEGKIICVKKISAGMYKEEIKINSSQGKKSVFVNFIIAYTQNNPLINLNPLRLDMGSILPEENCFQKNIVDQQRQGKIDVVGCCAKT